MYVHSIPTSSTTIFYFFRKSFLCVVLVERKSLTYTKGRRNRPEDESEPFKPAAAAATKDILSTDKNRPVPDFFLLCWFGFLTSVLLLLLWPMACLLLCLLTSLSRKTYISKNTVDRKSLVCWPCSASSQPNKEICMYKIISKKLNIQVKQNQKVFQYPQLH